MMNDYALRYRWAVLFFTSMALFGSYYIYSSISPAADLLRSDLGFSDKNIGFLYTVNSIPNLVVVLLGGMAVDRLGSRTSTLIFSFLVLAGAWLTSLQGDLSWMAAGRFLFGLGSESLTVAVTTVLAYWFRGRELAFAFGLNLTFSRLGAFAAMNSPMLFRQAFESWRGPLLIAVGAGIIGFVSILLYIWVERKSGFDSRTRIATGSTSPLKLKDLLTFSPLYWYLVVVCFTFYAAVFPFLTFSVKYFKDSFQVSIQTAGAWSSLVMFISMVATPVFGWMADRFGRWQLILAAGSLVLVPAYPLLVWGKVMPVIPMVLVGVSLSIVPAVIWPAITYVVDDSRLGTANGLMFVMINLGLSLFNMIVGWANDMWHAGAGHPSGYQPGLWILFSLGMLSLGFSFLVLLMKSSMKKELA